MIRKNHGLVLVKCRGPLCDRPVKSKGLCITHGRMQRRGAALAPIRNHKNKASLLAKPCSVTGCGRPLHCLALCSAHYKMQRIGKTLRALGPAQMHGERRQDACSVVDCAKVHFGKGFCVRHYNILRTYGFSPHNYERILRIQNGRCAICETATPGKKGLSLDHDHETGAVRGLLCTSCNIALGNFRDDEKILEKAIWYLSNARPFNCSIRSIS